ncbi:MAG: SPASM domain-containing protein [Candidatus Diapherotrites archaeon]|nr:SPASM domain-containing protein [Candidatus Diapherotrites archaeon]
MYPARPVLKPNLVQVEGIDFCNAKCGMCPVPVLKRAKALMKMDLFRKIIQDCVEVKPLQVMPFLNGEPFLDPLIFERIACINELLPNTLVKLISNAELLDERKLDKLLALKVGMVSFSVNAYSAKAHREVMGLDHGKVMANIDRFIEKSQGRIPYKVTFVSQKENLFEEQAFKDYWHQRGVRATALRLQDFGGHVDLGKKDSLQGRIRRLFSALQGQSNTHACGKLFNHLTVMADGRVNLCCFDAEGQVIVGDLNEQSVMEVWNGEKLDGIRRMHLAGKRPELPLCGTCTAMY